MLYYAVPYYDDHSVPSSNDFREREYVPNLPFAMTPSANVHIVAPREHYTISPPLYHAQ